MEQLNDLSKLCIHTITTKPWSIETAAMAYAKRGVKGITVWRETLAGRDVRHTGRLLRDLDLEVVSLCRGGFFAAKDSKSRLDALDDNRKAIDQAHELGTNLLVMVCGADPAQSLEDSRAQIRDAIADIIPEARTAGVKLAIEPLHPMYADMRSAINTLKQANDMVEELNASEVGVAIDVYHLWWDPELQTQIRRCARNKSLLAFHVCDWRVPTRDMLNDRTLMGNGCIPIRQIREWVESTGFKGYNEVEIFSNEYWAMDQSVYLNNIITSYQKHV